MLVSEIYHKNPATITENCTVKDALHIIIKKKINGLIVLNQAGTKVVGVLAVQDIAAATIPRQMKNSLGMAAALYKKGFFHEMCKSIQDFPVKKIMRRNFESVCLDDHIMAITADFLHNDLYIVPVIENNKLVGVIARSEIKKALAYGMGVNTT